MPELTSHAETLQEIIARGLRTGEEAKKVGAEIKASLDRCYHERHNNPVWPLADLHRPPPRC